MIRRSVLALALGLAALTGLSCSADDPLEVPSEIPDDAVDMTGRSSVVVRVTDNRFTERVIVVSAGTRVTWVNEGLNSHNVRPTIENSFTAIATEALDNGGSGSVFFRGAGDFPYYCSIHGSPTRGQNGRVIVVPA